MKRRVPQPVVIALIVLGVVLAGAGGWFLVIGRSARSCRRSREQDRGHERRHHRGARADARGQEWAKIRVADVYRLTKAMPDQVDMPGIILELNQIAEDSGITFEQYTPATTATPISAIRDPDHGRVPGNSTTSRTSFTG